MAEGTYEYECMRAELLGIEKPDYDEWLKNKQSTTVEEQPTEEDIDIENLKEVEGNTESLGRITGGLDELNNILQSTQKKINRFKASCGSLTNLLKIRIGSVSNSSTDLPDGNEETNGGGASTSATTAPQTESTAAAETSDGNIGVDGQRKSDLAKALDNHVDKLDALINKAENAQYSMAHQTKEMKRFIK